jgi:hypothetical protein
MQQRGDGMATGLAQRIVGLHPIVLTTVVVAVALAQLVILGSNVSALARGTFMLAFLGPMCIWLWAVFHTAGRASSKVVSSFWEWVFAASPAMAFTAGVAGWSTHNSPAAYAIFLSLFIGLAMAAKTLESADAANGSASIGRMLVTALLMYLFPIGVWVLRPKVLRVAQRANGATPVTD